MKTSKTIFLLVNTGSPDNPDVASLDRYLKQFLMDKHVIDLPYIFRWILVHWLIVPKRKYTSAELYKKIWEEDGSPLLSNTAKLVAKVNSYLKDKNIEVVYGMGYGSPSVEQVWEGLIKDKKLSSGDRLVIVPMFPQEAMATTGSVKYDCEKIGKEMEKKYGLGITAEYLPPFYNKDFFIQPAQKIISDHIQSENYDHLLFSFHGLPESHIKKSDRSGKCLANKNCCEKITENNKNCYRAQCFTTVRSIVDGLDWGSDLNKDQYSVSFQSRLGRAAWIQPYTTEKIKELKEQGVKRLAVACPSFVADCLETLEEIKGELREEFLEIGGEELTLIPCLNDNDLWAESFAEGLANY